MSQSTPAERSVAASLPPGTGAASPAVSLDLSKEQVGQILRARAGGQSLAAILSRGLHARDIPTVLASLETSDFLGRSSRAYCCLLRFRKTGVNSASTTLHA